MKKRAMGTTSAILVAISSCLIVLLDARTLLGSSNGSSKETVVDGLACSQTFGILKAAVAQAGLTDALTDPDADITLFAPTNKAFAAALEQLNLTQEELLESDALADILKYHVISGKTRSENIPEGETTVASLLGPDIKIINTEDAIAINDATVVYADITTDNGIVHVIDQVLLPPAEEQILG